MSKWSKIDLYGLRHKFSPKNLVFSDISFMAIFAEVTVTVTVTEALVLCPLLEDRGRIAESIRILVPVNRIKQKCFQITTEPAQYISSSRL